MKAKKIELDVDFIGGQSSLTIAEEKALSEFFKQRKEKRTRTEKRIVQKPKRELELA